MPVSVLGLTDVMMLFRRRRNIIFAWDSYLTVLLSNATQVEFPALDLSNLLHKFLTICARIPSLGQAVLELALFATR